MTVTSEFVGALGPGTVAKDRGQIPGDTIRYVPDADSTLFLRDDLWDRYASGHQHGVFYVVHDLQHGVVVLETFLYGPNDVVRQDAREQARQFAEAVHGTGADGRHHVRERFPATWERTPPGARFMSPTDIPFETEPDTDIPDPVSTDSS